MAGFSDREKGFENKFKHDEELRFKAMARRNKLLGLWAAEQMGIEGEAANVYALEVVKANFEEVGDGGVLRKVLGDLESKGIETSTHIVRKHMDELMHTAIAQVSSA